MSPTPRRRAVVLIPTNDPAQIVRVADTGRTESHYTRIYAGTVLRQEFPVGCERHIRAHTPWVLAGRAAAHKRGLKLRGLPCCLFYLDEFSDEQQAAIEQDIIAAEMGLDASCFDAAL